MRCAACQRELARDATSCPGCATPVASPPIAMELVLAGGERVPLTEEVTLGRSPDNRVQLGDPSVSRHHARVVPFDGGARVEDAGSTYGTFLDGRRISQPEPLRHGAEIRLGDVVVSVQRPVSEWEAGETVVVVPTVAAADGARDDGEPPAGGDAVVRHPRVRAGWALKRLDAREGERRYVLRDLETGRFLRMSADEAAMFSLLDGRNALPELLVEAERRLGDEGPAVLARLLADLGARGLLEGVDAAPGPLRGRLARAVGPRELATTRADAAAARVYRAGGRLLVTRPALAIYAVVAVAGLAAFIAVLFGGDLAPFLVRSNLGLGIAAFVFGRFLVVAFHEGAHAHAVVATGRHIPRAGLKVVLIFPYVFVDTSEAWFEPRRRRMLISAAGPISDLTLGGIFALIALAAGDTIPGHVGMQLALAGYVGALFNLNPMLDRDGYHLLVDALRQPNLRLRSRRRLAHLLAGRDAEETESGPLLLYGVASIVWSIVGLGLVALIASRYADALESATSPGVTWTLLAALYVLLAVPVLVTVGRPLYERWRAPALPDERPVA